MNNKIIVGSVGLLLIVLTVIGLSFMVGQAEAKPPAVDYTVCMASDADPTTWGYNCEIVTDADMIESVMAMNYNDAVVWIDPVTDLVKPFDCTNKASFMRNGDLVEYRVYLEPCTTDTCLLYTDTPYTPLPLTGGAIE